MCKLFGITTTTQESIDYWDEQDAEKVLHVVAQINIPVYIRKTFIKEGLIMANQTLLFDVSDEMKLNDNVQPNDVKEQEENLYSSSLDTTEELCYSSEPDTCGVC